MMKMAKLFMTYYNEEIKMNIDKLWNAYSENPFVNYHDIVFNYMTKEKFESAITEIICNLVDTIDKTIKAEKKRYYKKSRKYRDDDFNWGKFEGSIGALMALKENLFKANEND